MKWWNPRNWLGETRKDELLRRLEAVEGNVQEMNMRLDGAVYTHLKEFHKGQEAESVRDPWTEPDAGFGGQDITYER